MKRACMALIRFYQRHISPRKACPTCRFTPTCSAYALQAFETRGFFAGMALTFWRILRCNPFSPYGYDPVPQKGFRTMPMRWSKYDRTAQIMPSDNEENASGEDASSHSAPTEPSEDG